jgi:hypothetical protein
MDASRSRLYLFENTDKGLVLVADYYASVGKLGTEKVVEGDQRTPLGVYYITSRLGPAAERFLRRRRPAHQLPQPAGQAGQDRQRHLAARHADQFSRAPGHRRLPGPGQPGPGRILHRGAAHHPGGHRAPAAVGPATHARPSASPSGRARGLAHGQVAATCSAC